MYNISVVIPTYNRERYIERAINSVLGQREQGKTFNIEEVIIVDDGSSDNTEKVVNAFDDDRILFFHMPQNMGAAAARNKGAEIAQSDWLAFQDSDDVWHEDKLKKQTEHLKLFPESSLIFHPIKAIFDNENVITTQAVIMDDMVKSLSMSNCCGTPTMLVRRDHFLEAGGFDIRLKAVEDWEFALRFADMYKLSMVDEALIDTYVLNDGISSGAANYYEARCQMIAWNKEILIKHGCLNEALRSLLEHAKRNDVLDKVSRILELYLTI